MLSDVSSLTDISSDDDTFVPPSKSKKGGKRAGQWTLKQVLKAPRTTQYSARTLYEEILNGKVDLDPEYQRDIVWPDAKQTGLIDSILRNFYIPPVIFAFSQSEDGEEKRTCIDGKQRLTSIQRFMDGQIPYKDSRTNQKFWYKLQPGETGKLLPQQYRQQFAHKQIVCVEYHDINDDAEREIFQRVQLGVALTPAERMQAIPGPWSQLIRDVLGVMEEYKLGEFLDWSSSRGRDFQSVCSAIYLMEKSTTSYPSPPVLDKWLQRATPPSKAFRERVVDTFAVFRQLALTKKFASVFQKPARVSPIEFIMTVILVDTYMRVLTLTQLAEAVRRMRDDVRAKHADIRANSKVTKTMLAFINSKFRSNLKADSTEKPALTTCRANPIPPPREKGKRKRAESESASESDSSSEDSRPLRKTMKKTLARTESSATIATSKSMTVTATTSVPVSRSRTAATTSTPAKSDTSTKVKPDEPKTVPKTDRLAGLRAAKAKAALGSSAQSQAPTPPPTSGLAGITASAGTSNVPTSVPHSPTMQVDKQFMDVVESILKRSQTPQQQQWPGQTPIVPGQTPVLPSLMMMQGSQTSAHPPGIPMTAYFPPQPPPPSMQPPPLPNGTASGTPGSGLSTTDPRQNPHRAATFSPASSTPAPSANTGSGACATPVANANSSNSSAPIAQKAHFDALDSRPQNPIQSQSQGYSPRSMSTTGMSGSGSGPQRRDSRFDRKSYPASGYRDGNGSNSGFRNSSPRQPPTEPRRQGLTSPGGRPNVMNGRSWYGGPSDSDVLSGYGSINGRDREKKRDGGYNANGGDSGWSGRGNGAGVTNGR